MKNTLRLLLAIVLCAVVPYLTLFALGFGCGLLVLGYRLALKVFAQ